MQRPAQRPVLWTDRIDRVLTHRLWGTLIFLLVMFLVFQSIYSGARPLMKAIDALFVARRNGTPDPRSSRRASAAPGMASRPTTRVPSTSRRSPSIPTA